MFDFCRLNFRVIVENNIELKKRTRTRKWERKNRLFTIRRTRVTRICWRLLMNQSDSSIFEHRDARHLVDMHGHHSAFMKALYLLIMYRGDDVHIYILKNFKKVVKEMFIIWFIVVVKTTQIFLRVIDSNSLMFRYMLIPLSHFFDNESQFTNQDLAYLASNNDI